MKTIIFWILFIMVTACFAEISLPTYDCDFEGLNFYKTLYADNEFLLLLNTDYTIKLYNVEDVNDIQLVYSHPGTERRPEIKVKRFDTYMFINFSSQHENFKIFDISDSYSLHEVDFEGDFIYRDFYADSLFLYAAVDSEGIAIYNHSTMELITTVEYDFPVQGVSVQDTILFVTLDTPGFDNVLVMNNADIFNPVLVNILDGRSKVLFNDGRYFVGKDLNLSFESRAFNFIYDYKALDLSDFPVANISNVHSDPVYCISDNFIHIATSRVESSCSGTSSEIEYETIHYSESYTITDTDTIRFRRDEDYYHSFSKNNYYFVTYDFESIIDVYRIDSDSLNRVNNILTSYLFSFITNDNYLYNFTEGNSSATAYELNRVGGASSPDDTSTTPTDSVVVYIITPEIYIQSESPFQSELQIQADFADYISITDISGRIVKEFEFDSFQNTVTWTPDDDMPTGAYLVTARNDKAYQTKMVVYLKR